jgi:hypothetical protein
MMRKIILQLFIALLFLVSLLATACNRRDENISLPEHTPEEESQIPFEAYEPECIVNLEPPEEEQQIETYRTFRIEELPDNEIISQIRTTTDEDMISDTARFFHAVEFIDVFELGAYEFTIIQEINNRNCPFNFHFYGERIYVCDDGFFGEDTDILAIRITDYDGNFIQQIEGISLVQYSGSLHISFEDFNFDGFLDMTIMKYPGGVRGGAPHHIWLWNDEINEFIFNEELSEISHGRNLEINTETRQVMAWSSSVAGRNYIFLEFIEGTPTAVSTLEWIHFDYFEWAAEHLDIDPPEGYTTVLIRRDLITDEEEMWYEMWM